jgi:hypothetical protein
VGNNKSKFEMISIVYNINLIFTKLYQTYHFIKNLLYSMKMFNNLQQIIKSMVDDIKQSKSALQII